MKKLFASAFVVLFASMLSINVYAGCSVSSDPDNNTGHCRATEGGGDVCYASGSGPACSGYVIIKKVIQE